MDEKEKNSDTTEKSRIKNIVSRLKKSKKKHMSIIILIAIVIAAAAVFGFAKRSQKNENQQITMATVERKSIKNTVTGSSSVEPNDSYDVSSIVTGEVLSDNFGEGDIVEKNQVLYSIASTDAQNTVESSQNALVKAQMSYEDAVYNADDSSGEIQKAKNTLLSAAVWL